jgi:membrane protease YdiL (CAAX protease family)
MTKIQAEYLLGIASLQDAESEVAQQASILDAGSIGQRQRYMAFMIALGDPDAAKQAALRMQTELLDTEQELNSAQNQIQEQLDVLASGGTLPKNHTPLSTELGWFGSLLDANQTELQAINQRAERKIIVIGLIFAVLVFSFCCGFIGLIICIVRVFTEKMNSSMKLPNVTHGVYSEVFALWLIAFVGLMSGAQLCAKLIAEDNLFISMFFTIVAFFLSLVVLFWARIRGNSWEQIRSDIGWNFGSGFTKEFLMGFVGYAMMLPILGLGILITLFLFLLQNFASGESDPFSGTSSGAHPIIVDIAYGGWDVRIVLVALTAIAAPIIEETMFRGVLYRQLRTSTHRAGQAISIILSILLTSFLFAAIHPQGWVAIPALMGIAISMNLMREWRGSLIPSVMVHGLSNGIVITMMIVFLS